jgi:hypothetical protein
LERQKDPKLQTAFKQGIVFKPIMEMKSQVPSPAHKVAIAHTPTGEFRQKQSVAMVIVIA